VVGRVERLLAARRADLGLLGHELGDDGVEARRRLDVLDDGLERRVDRREAGEHGDHEVEVVDLVVGGGERGADVERARGVGGHGLARPHLEVVQLGLEPHDARGAGGGVERLEVLPRVLGGGEAGDDRPDGRVDGETDERERARILLVLLIGERAVELPVLKEPLEGDGPLGVVGGVELLYAELVEVFHDGLGPHARAHAAVTQGGAVGR